MLLQYLTAAALAGGWALGAVANPVHAVEDVSGAVSKMRNIPRSHVLHERASAEWGKTWEKREKVPSHVLLPMRIGLQGSNLEEGHRVLMDISDPESKNYGKHMTVDEVHAMFAPPRKTVETVRDWLTSSGIHVDRISLSVNKQWLQFDATAAEAEDLLFTDYHVYKHEATGSETVATTQYHVPSHIQEHIDYVTPGLRLTVGRGQGEELRRKRDNRALKKRNFRATNTGFKPIVSTLEKASNGLPPLNESNCFNYTTNQCVSAQYLIPNGTLSATGNELGVFASLNQHYSKKDLDAFSSHLYPYIPNGTYPEERLIDGAIGAAETPGGEKVGVEVGVEANLDLMAVYPMIWPQKTVIFQDDDNIYEVDMTTGNSPLRGLANTFFDAIDGSYCTMTAYGETGDCVLPECLDPSYPNQNKSGYQGSLQCGVYKPTNVISISYGGGEADVPDFYFKRQCAEMMKLSLQGVTIVVASGDDGVASLPGDGGSPNGCAGKNGKVFFPSVFATCPYVLSVGATVFNPPGTHNKTRFSEVATTRFPSGGGFSNYFDVPDYQKKAVEEYFDKVYLPFEGYEDAGTNFTGVGNGVYKIGGRGYPDVAALGDNFVFRYNETWGQIGGTSLSAPLWAGIITRINEERIAVGKSTVGFVHPILYNHPKVFNDITEGSNPGCNSTGFPTAQGWDPVTGLGSPNYPALLKVFMDLP